MSTQNNSFRSRTLTQTTKGGFLFEQTKPVVLDTPGINKEFRRSNSQIELIAITLKTYESPEEVVHNHPFANESTFALQQDYLEGQFVRNLMKAAEKLNTYSVSFDDLNLREYTEKTKNRPNVVYMSPVVADAFASKHEVNIDELEDIFRSVYGLDLVVEEKVSLNSEGEAEFILGNTVILAHLQPGFSSSCIKTIYDGEEFFNQVYEDGKVKTVATYSIEVMNHEYGLRIEVQM
jgi:hypothetical protein